MSSGTRKESTPGKYPQVPVAAQRIGEWLAGEGGDLNLIELDLTGADLSGGEFSNAWFTEAALAGVNFTEAEFYRSNLQDADLTRANLTRVSLVRVDLDWALLRDAALDGANLVTTSLFEVDAAGSRWHGAQFANSPLLDVNLCGVDLTGAVFKENVLKAGVDGSGAGWCRSDIGGKGTRKLAQGQGCPRACAGAKKLLKPPDPRRREAPSLWERVRGWPSAKRGSLAVYNWTYAP